MKVTFIIFSVLLFIYMMWPQPQQISQFNPLPSSFKSTLSGDTWQIPNVAAYFSNNYRKLAVKFYQSNFQNLAKLPFPPYRLNYPPEYSFVSIKKHTDTTYLEELVYPLKESLYVNGFEPFYENGEPKYWGAPRFDQGGKIWYTKVTLRLYASSFYIRLIVFLGIISSIFLLFKLSKEIIFKRKKIVKIL